MIDTQPVCRRAFTSSKLFLCSDTRLRIRALTNTDRSEVFLTNYLPTAITKDIGAQWVYPCTPLRYYCSRRQKKFRFTVKFGHFRAIHFSACYRMFS